MSWLHDATREMLGLARQAQAAGVFPYFRPFSNVGPRVTIGGREYLNFTSNDYLGLSQHVEVKRAAAAAIERFGTGLGSSRLQATCILHEELEERLARWLGYEACAVFPSGYQALVGVLSAYLGNASLVALDNQAHASILDGVTLAKGAAPELEERFFRHNSVSALERILVGSDRTQKLAVVEGLYGADGDLAPLPELVRVCAEQHTPLLVDDAHGIGALGAHGRGAAEHAGVAERIDILVGTFSKVFGGVGGFVCAGKDLIEFLKLSARSFVFSASLPAAQVAGALAALELVEHDTALRPRLARNQEILRGGLRALGCELGASVAHVCPILLGDEALTMTFGARLFHEAHVILLPFIYPGVPLGHARLRCNVTAAHSESDLTRVIEAVKAIGNELGVFHAEARAKVPQ
ncbi:MAG: aminotransferase class I/II-fold pyridoxal phosphate-dependent enzyme [Planctomycetota bacterium]